MAEVDRLMTDDLGISLSQMMENAGRSLAHLARWRFLGGDPRDRSVVVLSGRGGNGGGGMVAARRLAGYGARLSVVTVGGDDSYRGVSGLQLGVLRSIGIEVLTPEGLMLLGAPPDLVVDALIGYGLRGDPRGPAATLVRWANTSPAPVLSLDVPSGLDAGSGRAGDPTVRAAATLTLALPKVGLRGAEHVGELYLADIGVPPHLYKRLRLEVGPIFAISDILRLPPAGFSVV